MAQSSPLPTPANLTAANLTLALDAAGQADRLLAALRDGSSRLSVSTDGPASTPMPDAAFGVLLEALSQMARGNVVAVTPIEAELTTQQAAEILGVCAPTWSSCWKPAPSPTARSAPTAACGFPTLPFTAPPRATAPPEEWKM